VIAVVASAADDLAGKRTGHRGTESQSEEISVRRVGCRRQPAGRTPRRLRAARRTEWSSLLCPLAPV